MASRGFTALRAAGSGNEALDKLTLADADLSAMQQAAGVR
jgi:hypothetical protein